MKKTVAKKKIMEYNDKHKKETPNIGVLGVSEF